MLQRVQIYAGCTVFAGALTLAAAAVQWNSNSLSSFLICLLLALIAATFKVTIPGLNSCITPSFVPIFLALGSMGWQETVVIAALAGLVQSIWQPKQGRLTNLQILFNVATLALASGSAYAVSHAVAAPKSLGLFLVAATVFQLVNVLTVSGVLCLVAGDSLRRIWQNCHFWSYPYHLAGAGLAAVWSQTESATATGSLAVLCAVMLYLMSVFYGELTRRVGLPVKTA